ncbi:MAG TPA: beta-ketoacyl-[acyl-carrier-protein] synthase family protein [Acidobacteriota bacterium]|nr:beta-ketoacyl-[acyl-carrier-protein] synthase family protein [Acidobacteriota bacterium]
MSARIVATGTGVISSLAAGIEAFETALYAGYTGIGPKTLFADSVPLGAAGEIRNFAPQQWLGSKGLRVLDRSARLLCVAAHLALESSGLSAQVAADASPDFGLVCGTMFGSVHSIASFDWSGLTEGPNLVNPMEFPNTVINSPAGQAAIKHRLRGVNSTISAGLVSGIYAIHYAMEFLRFGRAQALLAGGVEELCEESYLSCRKAGIISPHDRIRPFAHERDGTVLGEGSALWVLETDECAFRRGAKPFLEVCGFGSSHDAHSIDTFNVRAVGATSAIRLALQAAGVGQDAIGFIIANASGSPAGDAMEAHALQKVFGARLRDIPICAPKAAFGESLGASGALLAVTAGIALQKKLVPPTAGFESCEAGLRLSSSPQPFEGDYALVNCFGCDGNNAALVLRSVDGEQT